MTYVKGLKCRECGKPFPKSPIHVCEFCFGPLEVDYDYEKIAGVLSRETIRSREPNMWRYGELLPLLNSGKLELLDERRLTAQLTSLERRTSRSGRDSIDHAPGRHDDVINSVAGALVLAASKAAAPTPRYFRPGAKRDVWTRLN